ncbi:GPI ethanolamine phosphate transferase 3-like [Mizuhopecten yessoensis]|uniref:GPI ethanolamine phosphate transferase 3, catalytic subunit n=1 Tax=Mizuhopecten yessoensis TaxID=6573 RepID=A0A210PR94_MIZYE|nr:GPI ethanolamine phosphate transferase 3-like [Mizuhopecten yessoensis]OWF39015.1 GPI ethanolamine phosphate transferase 3 [Mizuhopecten yessoensis]
MALFVKYFFLLIFLVFMYTCSLLIFAKGFLLKRVVVDHNSSCVVDFTLSTDHHGTKGCWMHSRFNKAIIVVIDALRFDFMRYDHTLERDIPYKNKLPIIKNLLKSKPTNSKLYKFIADPPTTTFQRLKGLTTGSLPTFVDAGANFASSAITEDNVIDQLVKQGKVIKFLGDDTWMSLFPGRFQKAYPFPSFNVKDLHTVDNGILKHLYGQLNKKDWSVTIAHFLGVDHCGHRYGPDHPAMADKLSQMNEVISNITSRMKDDTILFVMGDHGMTATGDHGGDSDDELEAGLFIYSPVQITSPSTSSKPDIHETISQIDFVPTLALLMGAPIPFSNLGRIITDLFNHCPWWATSTSKLKQVFHAVKALRLNAVQVSLYLKAYAQVSSDFPINKYYELDNMLENAERNLQGLVTSMVKSGENQHMVRQLEELKQVYDSYISQVKAICQGIWAKFDLVSISIGIMSLLLTVLINVYFVQLSFWKKFEVPSTVIVVILFCMVYIVYAVFHCFFVGETISSFMVFLLGFVNIVALIIINVKFSPKRPKLISDLMINQKKDSGFPLVTCTCNAIVCLICFISFFSNSFVVHEDAILLFLAQSLIVIYCVKVISQTFKKHDTSPNDPKPKHKKQKPFDFMLILTHPAMLTIAMTTGLCLCLRLSMNFKACREEQHTCELSLFLRPLSGLTDSLEHLRNLRYFFSVGCLALTVFLTRRLLFHFGNLNGMSGSVQCVRYLLPLCACCCSLHWALCALPQKALDSLPVWQQTFLPKSVYILTAISVVSVLVKPLTIHMIRQNKDSYSIPNKDGNIIPQLYNQVKQNLQHRQEEQPPMVYGLATVFSAAIISVASIVTVLLTMLLGDGVAPSLFLLTLTMYIVLELYTAHLISSTTEGHSVAWDMVGAVVLHSVLSSLYFYTTGHQATVPAIRFEAAFVGFHGDFQNYALPAMLIHLNTFAAHVLLGVLAPLWVFWPLAKSTFATQMTNVELDRTSKGDFALFEDEELLKKRMFQLFTCLTLFSGIKVLGAVCAAGLHRRHLMVWKIFAPRFVFEAVSCFTVFGMCLLMFLFVMRVNQTLASWVKVLEPKKSQD